MKDYYDYLMTRRASVPDLGSKMAIETYGPVTASLKKGFSASVYGCISIQRRFT